MARKAIVDRTAVLELLKEGKTSQAVADRYGVSRQAIDLYRKQFVREGLLSPAHPTRQPGTTVKKSDRIADEPRAPYYAGPQPPTPPRLPTRPALSLDQAVDLLIQALTALKRVPELEKEIEQLKKTNGMLQAQFEEMQGREQKRHEQESRWFQAQNPGVMTYRPATDSPPQNLV
ncbi:MAG: helix-turn-helix domain-containing protein [Dehalococcoidia bacterium]|nr:helix-turn-helix domain-containing protein [Dehalococcoidia bacterium]